MNKEPKDKVFIPSMDEIVYDEDCPWVLTYRDKGPGGGWPVAFALYFNSEVEARDYWENNRHKCGHHPTVDILPLKRPKFQNPNKTQPTRKQ